jgi:3-oxoacyl-[acyl-carrier protein] reductase
MTAVVTGASRGIGRATALELAERGMALALLGRPSKDLDDTCATVRRRVKAEVVACDLSRPRDVADAAEAVLGSSGAPAVVVHNAAVIHRAPVDAMSDAAWNEQLDVNLRAPFLLTRALLPAMKRAGHGRFIYIGSISSTLGTPRASAYCASKWGLIGFMKSVAEELTNTGLMAMAVLPGSVDTRMLEGSGFPPRMNAGDVAKTVAHYAVDAPISHNGGIVEMFGV